MPSSQTRVPERTVLLVDIGGVLIDDPQAIVVDLIRRSQGVAIPGLAREYRRLSRALDSGSIPLRTFHARLCRRLGLGLPFPQFRRFVLEDGLRPIPVVIRALQRVKESKRVELVVLSNTSPYVWNALATRYGFGRLFDQKIFSFRTGLLKPSLEIFRLALRRTMSRPYSVVYLDDSAKNVRAARSLGIRAFWIRRPADSLKVLAPFCTRHRGARRDSPDLSKGR